MCRSSRLLLSLGLVLAGILGGGCLDDIQDDCSTDEDCGPGGRCLDDGVKFCVGPEGGSGGGEAGTGGTAGGGGTGGESGGGGSGGTGVELIPIDVPVVVHADGPLATFLQRWPRDVRELSVQVKVGDGLPQSHLLNDPPAAGYPLLPEGTSGALAFVVPAEIEVGTSPEILIRIESRALNIDGAALPFAVGEAVIGEDLLDGLLGALSQPGVAIPLSGHPDFDFDRDETGDFNGDCAPNDPTIHPGAVDVCNGVDSDCNPGGMCVVPLPEGQHALDVACSGGHCVAAVDGVGETVEGSALVLDASFETAPQGLPMTSPSGVAMWGSNAVVYDASALRVRTVSVSGESPVFGPGVDPSAVLHGPLCVSPFGSIAFGLYESFRSALYFNPASAVDTGLDIGCTGAVCRRDLSILKEGDAVLASAAKPRQAVIRHSDEQENGVLYLLFSGDSRLGIAVIRPDTGDIIPMVSGLKTVFPRTDIQPRNLGLNNQTNVLYISGVTESAEHWVAALLSRSTLENHQQPTTQTLPEGVCAGALAAHGSTLWVADECNGRLLRLPLDGNGMPLEVEGEPDFVTLGEQCSIPTHLAFSNGTGSDPALFVTCQGQANIVVLGRD